MRSLLWGHVAEWLRNGLQNRVHQFNSGRGLHEINDLDAGLVSHQIFESLPPPRWRLASGVLAAGQLDGRGLAIKP